MPALLLPCWSSPRSSLSAWFLAAVCAAVLGPASASAQDEAPSLPPTEAPPALTAVQEQKLDRALGKLRQNDAGRRAPAEAEVIAFGRGALPALEQATTTDHVGLMAGLQRCLVSLADLRDRELLERAATSERVVLRRFAAEAAGRLAWPAFHERLPALLADADGDVSLLAALSLAQVGREEGLGRMVDAWVAGRAAEGGSDRWSAPIQSALAGLAGKGPHIALIARLTPDKQLEKEDPRASAEIRLAAVAMLRLLADEAAVRGLGKALEDSHNLVQQAAIDAVRQLVEGQPPFQGATFQQIKELERLRLVMKSWPGFTAATGGR